MKQKSSAMQEIVEYERVALWPWSGERIVYKSAAIGDKETLTCFHHRGLDDSRCLARDLVLGKHGLKDLLRQDCSMNLVVVCHLLRGHVLELVLMDKNKSLLFGMAVAAVIVKKIKGLCRVLEFS